MGNFLKDRKSKFDLLKALRLQKKETYMQREVPSRLFSQCSGCNRTVPLKEKEDNQYICPYCGGYFPMPAEQRAKSILESGYEKIIFEDKTRNPLVFDGYEEKQETMRQKTALDEGVLCFRGKIGDSPTVLCVMDSRFFMGSMGSEVGERITFAFELATEEKCPVVVFCASGGARMQEGMYSLMQMAKTSAAAKRHSDSGQLFISCLTHPTTGGVTASFASLGDIILSEPKALIGFAGPRVIAQTMGKKLPDEFQKAEFLLEKGFVDHIVERKDMKQTLSFLLKLHRKEELV